MREHFHLFNKLREIASETGWELVIEWEQNAPFNTYDLSKESIELISKGLGELNEEIIEYMRVKVTEAFEAKTPLNFPAQLAILRRK